LGEIERACGPIAGNGCGVNLGSFYIPAKAVEESPIFVQQPLPGITVHDGIEALHIALVEVRAPQLLDRATLQGIGQTLTQLGRLGLNSVVVIDCENRSPSIDQVAKSDGWRKLAIEQADRIVEALESNAGPGARRLDSILFVAPASREIAPSVSVHSGVGILFKNLLWAPLKRGMIPVIAPVGYTAEQIAVPVRPDDVVIALTREFAGLAITAPPGEDPIRTAKKIEFLQRQISLDRLIILDPLGGVPSPDRPSGAHVYINMEQEFEDIRNELTKGVGEDSLEMDVRDRADFAVSSPGNSSNFSKSIEAGIAEIPYAYSSQSRNGLNRIPHTNHAHLRNLELIKRTLSLLPPTSSALLTTPQEAANSGRAPSVPFQASRVGTRSQRNPLIHNLLTDKPVFSSSLPAGRLGSKSREYPLSTDIGASATTLVKRGVPLTVIPDPRISPWAPPDKKVKGLTLEDSRVDLPRLVDLIEDSFNRKLDVQHYLSRVNSCLAGLIIAGEYEGGALLTWEMPPDCDADGSEASQRRLVPYLDKFAVLKRSQGAGGVADIVFKAMVSGCFPKGVCWRSRRDNPVNKWYFERARGTWKIPDTNWTMFWTTENVTADSQTFLDYESVCRTVVPSWADKKAVAD
jgi:amino-acid N-acetyltransferase